jgi:hypothetical protein
VPDVVVKHGAQGAYLLDDGNATHVSAVRVGTWSTRPLQETRSRAAASRLDRRPAEAAAEVATHVAAAWSATPTPSSTRESPLVPAVLAQTTRTTR